jgi:hypothetical protein
MLTCGLPVSSPVDSLALEAVKDYMTGKLTCNEHYRGLPPVGRVESVLSSARRVTHPLPTLLQSTHPIALCLKGSGYSPY